MRKAVRARIVGPVALPPSRRLGASWVVATCVLLACRHGVRGDEPVPGGARIDDATKEAEPLFAELKSESFRAREAARTRLAALALRIRPLLESRRDDPDPEVRRVVLGILASIGATTEATAPTAALTDADLVTLKSAGRLADVLAALERVCAGRVVLPAASSGAEASVDVTARPYFEVLDALLAPVKLEVSDGFDGAGQARTASRDTGAVAPVAYAGPFRLDVESVSTSRMFRAGSRPRIVLGLRLLWSPMIQVVSYSAPGVTSATDETGAVLLAPDTGNLVYGVAGSARAAVSLALSLEPSVDVPPQRIERLEVSLHLRVRRGRASLAFERPGEGPFPVRRALSLVVRAGEAPVPADVLLEGFAPDDERPGWFEGVVSARLPAGVSADGLTAALESSDASLHPMTERTSRITSADGSVRMTLRAPPLAAGVTPAAVRVSAFGREEDVAVGFTLGSIPLR